MSKMIRCLSSLVASMACLALADASYGQFSADVPTVRVEHDNVEITSSCRIEIAATPMLDEDGNGVIQITGNDITVRFADTPLRGAEATVMPDRFSGIGVHVTGSNVTLENASVHGFKVGILAVATNGLTIDSCDVSDNFSQQLRSMPSKEDLRDWLSPHTNDDQEWRRAYGAGICVENATGVTVRNCRARLTQNGIVLDRVQESRVHDNDCSFLSGWGLAMWRSSDNTISRNAFDFCIRGYSHGVYNRGQDSAGILLFEQCSRNVIARNSATHCGDGLFGFAGQEALGQAGASRDLDWYKKRGNNDNLIVENDFSYAAAHGIEMTFSFGNRIYGNRLVGNAICGIWAGYSRNTHIAGNTIEQNGEVGYGHERGGINIEHGAGNSIEQNSFRNNACGVHLWSDKDSGLAQMPWTKANGPEEAPNLVLRNRFEGDSVGVHLVTAAAPTHVSNNTMSNVGKEMDVDDASAVEAVLAHTSEFALPDYEAPGSGSPIGQRAELAGREHIVMTVWSAHDGVSPALVRETRDPTEHVYQVLGAPDGIAEHDITFEGQYLDYAITGDRIRVSSERHSALYPYVLRVTSAGRDVQTRDTLQPLRWHVRAFPWDNDPREDIDGWRRVDAVKRGVVAQIEVLDFDFGAGGPSDLDVEKFRAARIPVDRFGIRANLLFQIEPGRFRMWLWSDDGVNCKYGGDWVIEDLNREGPRVHTHEFSASTLKRFGVLVEYFELEGDAKLIVDFECLD